MPRTRKRRIASRALLVRLLVDFPYLCGRDALVVDVLLARAPPWRVPRLHSRPVHLVDLLQAEALGLGDKEVDVDEAEDEHAEEDEQDKRPDLLRDTRGEEAEQEVPKPIYATRAVRSLSAEKLSKGDGDLLVALPRAIAFGRTRRGKLSPRYTHGVGPQKIENENTCRTANAMSVSPPRRLRAVSWSAGVPVFASVKCPTRPAMTAQVASMTEPVRRELRRPQVSMRYNAGTVPTTDTPPRIA